MNGTLKVSTLHATGRRPNAAEGSIFLPREDPPEVSAENNAAKRNSTGKGFGIAGAVIVWSPNLFAIVYTIMLLIQGTDYAVVYGLYILTYFWILFLIGGIFLHVAARKLNTLRRFTGTLVILSFSVGVANLILALVNISASDFTNTATAIAAGIPAAIAGLTLYFCVFAMAVVSVVLLRRAFPKKTGADSIQ